MVAPNGARKTQTDHPLLPVTSPELVQTALACWQEERRVCMLTSATQINRIYWMLDATENSLPY